MKGFVGGWVGFDGMAERVRAYMKTLTKHPTSVCNRLIYSQSLTGGEEYAYPRFQLSKKNISLSMKCPQIS